jgi:hypothetical protein
MLPQKLNMFQYQPIETGINLDVYAKAIDNASKAYDTNITNKNLIDSKMAEMSLKASPNDKAYIEAIKAKVQNKFADLTETVSGNKRWDLANNEINDTVSMMAKDVGLLAINKSYENQQIKLEDIRKLSLAGHNAVDLGDAFESHSSIQPDGSVKVYESKIQPEANYAQEKANIAKQIKATVRELPLIRGMVEGLDKQQKIEELTVKMFKDRMPSLLTTYADTQTQKQEKAVFAKQNGITDPATLDALFNQKIANDFTALGDVLSYSKEDVSYSNDPVYAQNAMMQRQIANAQAKAAAKAKGEDVIGDLLYNDSGMNVNDTPDVTKGFNNIKIKTGIKAKRGKLLTPNEVMVVGDGNKPQKLEDGWSVADVDYTGFNATNSTGDKQFDGSLLANIKIKNGKEEKVVKAYVVNNDAGFTQTFATTSEIRRKEIELGKIFAKTGANKAVHISDTSNLITTSDGKPLSDSNIELEIVSRGKNNYGIKPVFKDGTTYHNLTTAQLKELGLQKEYKFNNLVNTAVNRTESYLRPMSITGSKVAEGDGEYNSDEVE